MRKTLTAVTCLFAWAIGATMATAQPAAPLADRLPEQSLFYLGWGGLGPNRAALEATGPGLLANDPEVKPHLDAMLRQLEAFLKQQAEKELPAGAFEAIRSLLLDVVADRPWAVSVIDIQPPGPEAPVVEIALLIDTGDGTDAAAANVDKLLKLLLPPDAQQQIQAVQVGGAALKSIKPDEDGPSILWGAHKRHFLLAISQEAAAKVVAALDGGGARLSGNPQFAKVLARTGGGLCCFYADVARFRRDLLPSILELNVPDEQDRGQVDKVLHALGLDAIDAVGAAMRADGRDFVRNAYLLTRTKGGLLMLADQKPVSPDLLSVVPGDATFAMVGNFNRGRLMDELTTQLAAFPEVKAEFDKTRKAMEDAIGMNLRTDLAEAVGDGIAVYNSPSAGGFLFSGLTVVAEVKNADKVRAAMPKLIDAILGQAAQSDPEIREQVTVAKGTFKGKTFDYLVFKGLPVPVAPSWCVTDRYLVFSLFPQTMKAGLLQIEAGRAGSLMENQWLSGQLAGPARGACAISYVNERQLTRIIYPALLPLWQMGCAMAAKAGVQLDVNALPRQELLLKYVGDSFGAIVPDPEGILCTGRSSSPLPSVVGALITNPALTASVLLPALYSARSAAQQTQSAANLHGLGLTMRLYATSEEGRYPDTLDDLVKGKYVSPEVLRSPRQKGPGPSYVYLKPANPEAPNASYVVVAYERLANYDNKGTVVLFLDGHVQWLDMAGFEKLVGERR